jgi:hypothetical protein
MLNFSRPSGFDHDVSGRGAGYRFSMAGEDPPTEELKLRQLAQEHAEREQLADAENEAEAERHRRRADKAGYLRQKLEERERSEREAGGDDRPPPAA